MCPHFWSRPFYDPAFGDYQVCTRCAERRKINVKLHRRNSARSLRFSNLVGWCKEKIRWN